MLLESLDNRWFSWTIFSLDIYINAKKLLSIKADSPNFWEYPMKKVASLRYGVIFKKAFSQPDIFKAFVKDFIGIELQINQVEMEKEFSPVIGKVDTRFDLFAEDIDNRVIVDIQHVRYGDHYDRFLHYHCVALLEKNGEFYKLSS